MTTYKAPSIKRAFDIIMKLGRSASGLTLSELSRELNLSKATVHGLVKALVGLKVLLQDKVSKKYILGPTLLELGRLSLAQMWIKDVARPIMQRLMEDTGGTVYLGIQNNMHVTILEVVESSLDMKITSPKGSTVPIFAAALGKIMLGFLEESEQRSILSRGLPKFTEFSITEPENFLEEVKKAQALGYALDQEEYMYGVWAAAAPIRNWMDIPTAVWVVGFKAVLEEKGLIEIAIQTKKAAEAIEKKLITPFSPQLLPP